MATDLDAKIRELESKPHLSEFENQRLQTLKENRELFATLGLGSTGFKKQKTAHTSSKEATGASSWLIDSGYNPDLVKAPGVAKKPPSSTKNAKKRAPRGKDIKVETAPRARYSLRLRGIDAVPENIVADQLDSTVKVEDTKDTRLAGLVKFDATDDFVTALNGLAASETPEYESLVKASEKDVKSWREKYEKLAINLPDSSLKATKERIYSCAWHPQTDTLLYVVGDKAGSLAILNYTETEKSAAELGDEYEPKILSLKPHSGSISTIKFNPKDSCKLFTSSYDGSVRVMDLSQQAFDEVFVHPDETWLTWMDFEPDYKGFYFSDGLGYVGYKDLREPAGQAYFGQFSAKKVTTVSVHPLQPHYVLTAGLSRQVELFDVRKLRSSQSSGTIDSCSVQESLVTYEQHSKSVNSALWTSDGQNFITTSYDDTVRSWPSPVTGSSVIKDAQPSGIHALRHNNRTGKWVTNFKATPHPHLPLVIVGNMSRQVDIYHSSTLQTIAYLQDSALTAVPAVNSFHPNPELCIVGSGNASGRVVVWT